ncbi:MAG: hypothetical protein MK212_01090 [Saprospiraceae bacterium]|nr:hypothetical protein [Saprospiraceae bacterium]
MAEFGGKIKRIRIRPTGKPSEYKIIVVVKDDTNQQVKEVEVQFNDPFEGPDPVQNPVNCGFVKYVEERKKSRFVYKPETFDGDPIDASYNVTATMKDGNGNVLGVPTDQEVMVEDPDDETDLLG